ncbi:hypothetical protein [Fictibacillus barbaricus]|uniref:Uncharacterized protein n=1 Tax=Fictibacillus barbaricus TaxID=182136 RepID=A0ABU1U463_9BACL|nr:hypothetical protein [Fictibacillus barbaricus]MDR7074247.1 hypothetical protein [Fictibacillus barbaricus]
MKKRNQAVLFVLSSVLAIGVYTANDDKDQANATAEKNSHLKTDIVRTDQATSKSVSVSATEKPVAAQPKTIVEQRNSNTKIEKPHTDTKAAPVPQVKKQSAKKAAKQEINKTPDFIMSDDGYKYVNLMTSNMENLSNLINIARKHHAVLYGIEESDCFAMFAQGNIEKPIMLFSSGSRSVSIEHVGILYDMHPAIKDQIKEVVETGKEMTVGAGEYESYYIKKEDGMIKLSY